MRTSVVFFTICIAWSSAVAQKSGPPDRPTRARGAQIAVIDRAIAPYVAKARATYPAARKRFLAGLPPNHRFSVWIRLDQADKKSREFRHEEVFVAVDAIKNGQIYGRINNKILLLTNYRLGERIQFPESRVKNWLILRPDGTEEGNYVGKFLDHWRPPKR
jgi:uncharacterized protein YegJ (DUF2314 family)